MTGKALVVFTFRSLPRIVAERGSQAWSLSSANARRCRYIVCTRNRHFADASPGEQAAAQEEHRAAFMVGRITTVEPSPERTNRHIVRFDEYAVLDIPDVWSGARNPVWYVDDIKKLGIEPDTLNWLEVPDEAEAEDTTGDPYFDKFAGPLGHVILEFNYLEVDAGRMIARLLKQDDVTATIFAGAIPFIGKVKLIQMLVAAKVHDDILRREFDVFVKNATDLNAKRNRYVHSEYMPVMGPNDELVKMLHRRLKDGGKSADGSAGRTIQNLLQPVDEKGLKALAAEIHQLAFRTRSLAEKYNDQFY